MVAGCGAKISKMILFIFNFLVWLVSIILIGLGGYILAREGTYSAFFGDSKGYFTIVCWAVIVVGILIFILAFAGCFGAIKESGCLLKVYIAILLLLVILEVAGGIVALVFRGKVEKLIKDEMVKAVKVYEPPKAGANGNFVDVAQQIGDCCGTGSYKDWENNTYYQTVGRTEFVPISCCKNEKDVGCNNGNAGNTDIADSKKIKIKGCLTTLVDTAKEYFLILGAVAIAMIAAEIVAMIFACCVISGISNGEYE